MEEEKHEIRVKLSTIIAITLAVVAVIGCLIIYIYYLNVTSKLNQMQIKDFNDPEVISEVYELDKITGEDDKEGTLQQNAEIVILPTMKDKVENDSTWCATFQLVWNDMIKNITKADVVFTPQEPIAENLNKQEFTEDMISEEYYYKKFGPKTLELKTEIEKGIKEKFNQNSDILEDFDWSENSLDNPSSSERRYFLYTMLYREFGFLKEFDKLGKSNFGNKYNNVEYFGIDTNTDDAVRNQIEVLYYNSKDDFAVLINTKSNDEVIFCKKPQGENFETIYKNMIDKSKKYEGSSKLASVDLFKAPVIKLDKKREYEELQGKDFPTPEGSGRIEKAVQSIKFELDNKGGRIKSEAGLDVTLKSAVIINKEEPRYFYVDDTFAIFLREKGRDLPYFAGRIEDITKFQ